MDSQSVKPAALRQAQAARYLGIGLSTLKRLVARGEIRRIKMDASSTHGGVLFRIVDLDSWLESKAKAVTEG